jgi:hypothetical protein
MFNVAPGDNESLALTCLDKFGKRIEVESRKPMDITVPVVEPDAYETEIQPLLAAALKSRDPGKVLDLFRAHAAAWDYNTLRWVVRRLGRRARHNKDFLAVVIDGLTLILDRRFPIGEKKRSAVIRIVTEELYAVFNALPRIADPINIGYFSLVDFETRKELRP